MKTKVKVVKQPKKGSMQARIMRRLNANIFVKPRRLWLDSGSPAYNAVMGSSKLGLPAGMLFHLAGKKHGGKTVEAIWLGGKAQREHDAFVLYIDDENSFSPTHVKKLGLQIGEKEDNYASDNFYLIQPKVLKRAKARKSKKKDEKISKAGSVFLQGAEFLFAEAEEVMTAIKEENPDRPIFLILDSIANLQTEMAIELGLENSNMRAALDRAQFLSAALPRWIQLARNYTMWVFMINQIRVNPQKMFGDPEYSPGGNATEHNCHVMSLIRRKGKPVKDSNGKTIKISGYMVNKKNKAGGGSYEGAMCSYIIDFTQKDPDKILKFAKFKKKMAEVKE